MSGQSTAEPGVIDGNPGQRLIEGIGCNPSSLNAVFNAISEAARTYEELQQNVHERRPRLMAEAVDRALWQLITVRAVVLTDDGSRRWAVRP